MKSMGNGGKGKSYVKLRNVALDIDDEMSIPEGYDCDEMISQQAKAFLVNVKEERKRLKKKKKGRINDVEVNVFPDNNRKVYEIYQVIGISGEYIEVVKKEYGDFKEMIKRQYCSSNGNGENVTYDSIKTRFKLHKEMYKLITIPTDSVLEVISGAMNNQLGMKMISLMHSLFIHDKDNGGNIKQYEILMWIYMFLAYIEMPLVDDDNSILYSLNKYLHIQITSEVNSLQNDNQINDSNTLISMKIIYIIISEIFKQKIIS